MKTSTIYFLGLVMVFLTSCSGMNDNIEEYLDRGEIEYLGRPDLAYTQGGFNRINIIWLVNEDPRITGCTITWNNRDNKPESVSYPIDRNDLISVSVDGTTGFAKIVELTLEEGTYVFKIVHTGDKGYPSIATEVSGRVYGESFIATLHPRRINAVTTFKDRTEINWAIADENEVSSLLKYETVSGTEQTVEVSPKEPLTILTDSKIGGEYSWSTLIKPEANSIDNVSVASQNEIFPLPNYPLDKTGWTATANSNNPTWGQGPGAVIDGIHTGSSYWCAVAGGEGNWVQVDMKNNKMVTRIDVDERYNFQQIEIQSSLYGNEWLSLGTLSFATITEHVTSTLLLEEAKQMRYIRFLVKSGDGPGGIWEVDITGYDE